MKPYLLGALILSVMLAACSTQNKDEREADKITRSVIANDMRPVENDFADAPRQKMTRLAVARLSDQLNNLGKYKGIKEDTPQGSVAGSHTFTVTFAKETWHESMVVDSGGKISAWKIGPGTATAQ
ncbi:MAG: hypothetical protein M3Z14_05205 [Candidatus Eremiobacteraeota bacterium]|nr:hypothetical protein [Candidatus Eremiobacteraeota bacterium]